MEHLKSNTTESHIYKIINLVNGKTYVGKRKSSIRKYVCSGTLIRRAINKHGCESFKKEIVVQGNFNKNLLNELEKHYIRLFNSNDRDFGYNLTNGGDGSLGLIHSQKTKNSISKKLKGVPKKEETKKKFSIIHKGKTVSVDSCKKISESKKGSIPWNKGIKTNHTPWNKGLKHNEDIRKKLSENSARKGKPAINRKPIKVFDLNGNYIDEVSCRDELSKKGFLNLGKINKVLNGSLDSWNGYIYKYSV